MINHNVVRLNISMSDTFWVTEVQSFQDFIHVESDVEICEGLIESSEVNITGINVLHNQGRCLSHRVSHNINQVYNVNSTLKCLQNFDFSSDLCLLNYTTNQRISLSHKVNYRISLPGFNILMTILSLFAVLIPS